MINLSLSLSLHLNNHIIFDNTQMIKWITIENTLALQLTVRYGDELGSKSPSHSYSSLFKKFKRASTSLKLWHVKVVPRYLFNYMHITKVSLASMWVCVCVFCSSQHSSLVYFQNKIQFNLFLLNRAKWWFYLVLV